MKNNGISKKVIIALFGVAGAMLVGVAALLVLVVTAESRMLPPQAAQSQNQIQTQPQSQGQESVNDEAVLLAAELAELQALIYELTAAQNAGAAVGTGHISDQEAIEAALQLVGHGELAGTRLFTDNGVLAFEVDIRQDDVRYMVYINAMSGNVIRMTRHEDGYQGITTLPEVVPPVADPPTADPPTADPPIADPPKDITDSTVRFDEIGAVAILANGGGGLMRHMCLDRERGRDVYHVRLYDSGNRVDIYLDRSDLSVVRNRSRYHGNASSHSNSFQRRQMNTAPSITWNQAANIAINHFGGGSIREISRSYTRDGPAFEVDVIATDGTRWEVYVDIHTGEILRYHRD